MITRAGSTGTPPVDPDSETFVDGEDAGSGSTRNETTEALGVASWTLVSRVSGLIRVAVAGAILGPTFFANIFQATNTVPNITYSLMAGSLLASLVVPALVETLDRHGPERARAVAQGLLGVVIMGFCAAGLVVIALGPIIVHLLTIGIPAGPGARAARFQAWVLLLLVVPQILLYGIAGLGIAAQNAQRRFLLAAAAPTVENVGLIATLLFLAYRFGSGFDNRQVPSGYLVLLGAGATLSVAAHAGLQVMGAARAGLPLWPRWGWGDPVVRQVAHRAVPAMGTAALDAGALFALIVAAGTVPGGVVALQIGLNFFNLPIAISARAVGTVMLPGLARDAVRGHLDSFAKAYGRALSTTWFVAVPASVALVLLARPIAQALSFGKLQHGDGIELVAVSVAGLAPALLGGSTNELAQQASYARRNVLAPLIAGFAQVVVVLAGVVVAVLMFDGASTLLACGVAVVVAHLVQALIVDRSVRRDLPPLPTSRWHALARHFLVSGMTIVPAALLGRLVAHVGASRVTTIAGVVGGTVAGLVAYIGVQMILHAPEVTALRRANDASGPLTPLTEGSVL
jgi:putative peptidoglycan lipid II flippase